MLIMVVKFTDFHKKQSPPSNIFKTHNLFLWGVIGEKSDLLLYAAVHELWFVK